MPELYGLIDTGGDLQLCGFNKGLGLGNQDHSTGMLMLSPECIFHFKGKSGAAGNWRIKNEHIYLTFKDIEQQGENQSYTGLDRHNYMMNALGDNEIIGATHYNRRDKSIEAYCDDGSVDDSPKLYQFLDKNSCTEKECFKLGLQFGNQYHRTGMLKKRQEKPVFYGSQHRDRIKGYSAQEKKETYKFEDIKLYLFESDQYEDTRDLNSEHK
eukprot:15504285-Heterocapsa_arctica.AAC.1